MGDTNRVQVESLSGDVYFITVDGKRVGCGLDSEDVLAVKWWLDYAIVNDELEVPSGTC